MLLDTRRLLNYMELTAEGRIAKKLRTYDVQLRSEDPRPIGRKRQGRSAGVGI